MQRPRFIAIVFLLALAGTSYAQQSPPAMSKPRGVLLWKATSPTTTAYLRGSIHVGDHKLYPLPASAEAAFRAAKILIVEVNAKDMDAAKTMGMVAKYGMYGPDDALSKHIDKETAASLDAYCSAHSLPRQTMELAQAVGGRYHSVSHCDETGR